jgi:hypothetical protein
MKKLSQIPEWATPALQGLSYWLGSQHCTGLAANISEGAIAWELMRLVHAHRSDGRYLEGEVLYRHVPELSRGRGRASGERADLVIANVRRQDRTISYARGEVEAVIEIKHNRSRKALVWEDIDFLADQRAMCRDVRAFFIFASVNERPKYFTSKDGSSITPRNRTTPTSDKSYRVRRTCRATQRIPAKNKKAIGHYSVLIEVAP